LGLARAASGHFFESIGLDAEAVMVRERAERERAALQLALREQAQHETLLTQKIS